MCPVLGCLPLDPSPSKHGLAGVQASVQDHLHGVAREAQDTHHALCDLLMERERLLERLKGVGNMQARSASACHCAMLASASFAVRSTVCMCNSRRPLYCLQKKHMHRMARVEAGRGFQHTPHCKHARSDGALQTCKHADT